MSAKVLSCYNYIHTFFFFFFFFFVVVFERLPFLPSPVVVPSLEMHSIDSTSSFNSWFNLLEIYPWSHLHSYEPFRFLQVEWSGQCAVISAHSSKSTHFKCFLGCCVYPVLHKHLSKNETLKYIFFMKP